MDHGPSTARSSSLKTSPKLIVSRAYLTRLGDNMTIKLNNMSKDDLISFMMRKGNERKRALYDDMQFQNKDFQNTYQFADQFE